MGLFDAFRYDGKRALVVGGATGMGAAVAELVLDAGAEVIVMDRADITLDGVKAVHLDLSDTASIEMRLHCRLIAPMPHHGPKLDNGLPDEGSSVGNTQQRLWRSHPG